MAANGDRFIYDNRMALFKSAENDDLSWVPRGVQASTTVQKRWWGQDSNLCSPFGRRFYRPLPLTARPPHPGARQLANFTSRLSTRARLSKGSPARGRW